MNNVIVIGPQTTDLIMLAILEFVDTDILVTIKHTDFGVDHVIKYVEAVGGIDSNLTYAIVNDDRLLDTNFGVIKVAHVNDVKNVLEEYEYYKGYIRIIHKALDTRPKLMKYITTKTYGTHVKINDFLTFLREYVNDTNMASLSFDDVNVNLIGEDIERLFRAKHSVKAHEKEIATSIGVLYKDEDRKSVTSEIAPTKAFISTIKTRVKDVDAFITLLTSDGPIALCEKNGEVNKDD